MSAFTIYELGSATALLPSGNTNSNFIKSSIGGAGNYRKNPEAMALTFETASGESVTSFHYATAGAALPSGADRMKEKLVGLVKSKKGTS